MKHHINPLVDCVFKALLGSERNKNLLIHFLNAILEPPEEQRLTEVEILNPYNEKESLIDKFSVVDIKASDPQGRVYQVEIQMLTHAFLAERMVYNWGKIYSSQLKEGERYTDLKPLISIWIVAENLFSSDAKYDHHFQIKDQAGLVLSDQFSLHVLELKKFPPKVQIGTEKERWLRFLIEGRYLDETNLPHYMKTPEMEQVMKILEAFSEREHQYDRYEQRMEYLRVQATIEYELQQGLEAKQKAEKAEVEAKKAQAEAKKAKENAQKVKAEAKQAQAEAKKAKENAQKVETEKQKAEAEAKRAKENAQQVEAEKQKAEAEAQQAKENAQKVEAEAKRAKENAQKVEAEKQKAEAEAQQAKAEAKKAKAEAKKAESEKQEIAVEQQTALQREKKYKEALKKAGIDPNSLL